MTTMTIGALAAAAGVRIDTLRYYERSGLLLPATRRASGYREYGDAELRRLRFIRRAQQLGFSLDEIGELLQLVGAGGDRSAVRALAEVRLTDIEQRLQRLTSLRDTLRDLVSACDGHGSVRDCPIIEAVVGEELTAERDQ